MGNLTRFTGFLPGSYTFDQTKQSLQAHVDVSLGGRVAEELVLGPKEISSGCGGDLVSASNIAYEMANTYGMLDDNYWLSAKTNKLSQKTRGEIDEKVHHFVNASLDRTKELLRKNRDNLKILAEKLLEKETLTGEEAIKLLKLDR